MLNLKSVDIVFPVYYKNIPLIEKSLNKVSIFCHQNLKHYTWKLLLAINGPFPDEIIALVKKIMKNNHKINYTYTPTPGKGAGIKHTWINSSSDLLAYMDIDLSVNLSALPILLDELAHYDLVIGSRYHEKSEVKRNFRRKIISKVYHTLFQNLFLGVKARDVHCGFKAVTADAAKKVLPYVQDHGWYFDSELVYLFEKLGYSVKAIPVEWKDSDYPSGVDLKRIIPGFILKTFEMKLRSLPNNAMKIREYNSQS